METMAVNSHSVCAFAQAVGSPKLAVVVLVVVGSVGDAAADTAGSVVEVEKMDTAVDRSRWKGLRSNHS